MSTSKCTDILLILFFVSMAIFGQEVNLYTHRHYAADKQLFAKFTEETGIKVNVVKANADQLIKRLEIEGEHSPADLLITVDAGRLCRAKRLGLLQPVQSEFVNKHVPAHLRDKDGYWLGLTRRARVIVYAKDRVKPFQLSTYESLTDPQWNGKILVRSSANIYNQSLLASLIANDGKETARKWAQGLVKNMSRTPKGNDRDQMKAIAAGLGDIAIVNSYYLGKMIESKNPEERKVAKQLGIFFPNKNGRGTHINVSGIGLTKSSKNKDNAIKLIEFLLSKNAQKVFATANFEYPVRTDIASSELLRSWGEFKSDNLDLTLLGKYNLDAVNIFDNVGWR